MTRPMITEIFIARTESLTQLPQPRNHLTGLTKKFSKILLGRWARSFVLRGYLGVPSSSIQCYDLGMIFRSPTRLWLLPDLGMDSRLFKPQAGHFSNLEELPSLADHSGCESLSEFAVRSVNRWLSEESGKSPQAKTFFLGGVGFGGILALELALEFASRSIYPAGVLLIDSTRSQATIPISMRLKLEWLRRLPPTIAKWRLTKTFYKMTLSEGLSEANKKLLQDMVRDSDWKTFRWQVNSMLNWKRKRSEFEAGGFPIYQLHGRGARNFCRPPVEDATLLIHGQQLINLSLPAEVNRWIESILRDHDLRQSQQSKA